eukprot:6990637-Alexandrium_andersonii.AAC.1
MVRNRPCARPAWQRPRGLHLGCRPCASPGPVSKLPGGPQPVRWCTPHCPPNPPRAGPWACQLLRRRRALRGPQRRPPARHHGAAGLTRPCQ